MLTVFGDFLVDGQDLALRLIYHLYIGGHFFCTGTDGYMLAFLYNIHELVVAVTLDCGFKGAYFTAQTAAFDIGDDLIHDPYPVSYTHLDVYKRQAMAWDIRWNLTKT